MLLNGPPIYDEEFLAVIAEPDERVDALVFYHVLTTHRALETDLYLRRNIFLHHLYYRWQTRYSFSIVKVLKISVSGNNGNVRS